MLKLLVALLGKTPNGHVLTLKSVFEDSDYAA